MFNRKFFSGVVLKKPESTTVKAGENNERSASVQNNWPVFLALLIAIVISVLGYIQNSPPPLRNSNSADQFSIARAKPILESLVGDNIPHPAGSEQNKIVRNRIIDFLDEHNIDYELHRTSNVYKITGETVPLVNIIAKIPGENPTGTVMLAAHYDSVPAGPGACDDGVGTAVVLEIGRMISEAKQRRNDLVLFISDGEEHILLGAEKFVREHPIAKEIDVVVNLEARGTTGPSLMFETGNESHWSIQTFSAVAKRPYTSSLFYEVYKRLPRDTDFSRFRELDIQGFNFAFIGNVNYYHTPNDNLENVDLRSFQHHGDHALGLANFLLSADLNDRLEGRAVYFDLLGLKVFYWPEYFSIVFSSIACVIFVFAIGFNLKRQTTTPRQLLQIAGVGLTSIVAVGLAGYLLNLTMSNSGFFDELWPSNPLPLLLVFWSTGICVVALICFGFFKDSSGSSALFVWFIWALLALALSLVAPGASYLFVVPVLFALLALALFYVNRSLANIIFWIGVCLIWLPIEFLLYDAVGFRMNLFLAVRVVIVTTALLPLISGATRHVNGWIAALAGASAVVCVLIARFS